MNNWERLDVSVVVDRGLVVGLKVEGIDDVGIVKLAVAAS